MAEIIPGIHWIRMPISLEESTLTHINVYLIEGDNGWLLVDSGWNTDKSFSTLHNYLLKIGVGFEDIKQIVITHVHPDHYGMAGRIKQISGATIAMHSIEKGFIASRYISMNELLIQTDHLLIASGVPSKVAEIMRDASLGLEQYVAPTMPDITLRDGDIIATGKFHFRVIWTPGHSSGHICLYEPERKILLSGDHVLPKITPNISLNPQAIENPLGGYLKSLEEIKQLDVKLTLPGHDRPFTRLIARIDEIIRHHDQRNAEILEAIGSQSRTPYQIAQKVTWASNHGWDDLPPFHQRMAIFETLAHLEMLAAEGRIDKLPRKGISYYRQSDIIRIMKTIGITTTVPVEILIAAGYQPIDLNNVLVGDPDPGRLITLAERAGFPLNCCSWIKGIYGVCLDRGIRDVICVTSGDCSNTIMLQEVLKLKGINAIAFAYPDRPDQEQMQYALEKLAAQLGATLEAAEKVRKELKPVRDLAMKLDELTWKGNKVSGGENHLWLVSASDFNGDTGKYGENLKKLIAECERRKPYPKDEIRLAYIGVPAVYAKELYPFIEKQGARVVFNEVQRQFAMPEPGKSLAEQYSNYTYPYSIQERIRDIKTEIKRRRIDGVIHYVQAFCHRGIGDIVFREALELPVLTLEGNADFFLNTHIKTRIEAFLDMIQRRRIKPSGVSRVRRNVVK